MSNKPEKPMVTVDDQGRISIPAELISPDLQGYLEKLDGVKVSFEAHALKTKGCPVLLRQTGCPGGVGGDLKKPICTMCEYTMTVEKPTKQS